MGGLECDHKAAGVLAQIEKGNKKRQGIQVKYIWRKVFCYFFSLVDNIFVVFSSVFACLIVRYTCNIVEQGRRG